MKRYRFHPAARQEFREAIQFYDERAIGLGHKFADDVASTILRIREMPAAWPKISDDVRRCLLGRFPYSILYRELKNSIEIVAVMHQRRQPNRWKGR